MVGPGTVVRSGRRRRTDGERTHAAILEAAARIASIEGVNGLTIGRLAESLGVSKSGLYAHFGSKERLQLETIAKAKAIFDAEVMQPAFAAREGLGQLRTLFDAFFSYVERGVFPGGCFFAGLLAEEDARDGPIHEVVVAWEHESVVGIADIAAAAQRRGEIGSNVEVHQLAFELYAFIELANFHFVLFRDPEVLERGRRSVADALERAAQNA
ncbi:MAG: TetR/AcrR family transcriptional regulator [Actinobacteria bacterium]|nr:TetR/AcrR family transcriptional regulator [Actinomycetota bacterium]